MVACALFSCQKDAKVNPSASVSVLESNKKKPVGVPVTTPTPASPAPVTDTVTSPLPVASIVTKGKWKIALYREGTSASTSKFNGYTFVFDKSGAITVDNNGQITSGTWLFLTAIFYYGIPSYGYSPNGFKIFLGTKKPLSLLSKNLFVSKKTTTNVYMDSINPAEDTHFIFVKVSN
ncbi:hypothetical protein A0256_03295 [Mucilaginibacter sp. PAMC 26640]|nr:hypothetical protein A0256_03295 [Mucilaginibacter sp. PAMC 26640]